MGNIGVLLFALFGAAVAAWLFAQYREIARQLEEPRLLTEASYEQMPPSAERVSVIIAARNEELDIRECVETYLSQDAPNLRVIVANDRSTDRTAEILEELKMKHGDKLSVVTINSLPEGLTGKCNAMYEAQKLTEDEWLCFSDGDCKQISLRTVSIALHEAQSKKSDFLSIWPTIEFSSAYEKITYPLGNFISATCMAHEALAQKKRNFVGVTGGFMLIHRGCYRAIGGHEKIARVIAEDMTLCRMADDHGFKVTAYESQGLYKTTKYRDMRSFWEGWGRVLSTTVGSIPGVIRIGIIMCVMISIWAGVTAGLAVSVLVATTASNAFAWAAVAAWSAACFAQMRSLFALYRRCGVAGWWALLFPLAAAITMALLGEATLQILGLKRTKWRGMYYDRPAVDLFKDGELKSSQP